jgi:hypothetical protein
MACSGGPDGISDGLVLALDAANKVSYPGSGTSWYDLSGTNNSTLTNGPTFSGGNGGGIVFDGTNDYVDFYAPNLGTTTTVELWSKLGSGYSDKMIFGWNYYDVWCSSGTMGYNTFQGDVYGISAATVSSLGLINNWKHYIFEMRSDVSYTNNKIYVNTVIQSLSQQAGGEGSGNRNFNSGNGRIASTRGTLDYFMSMTCAVFKVYNRALTAAEILQNYNDTKTRFGILS